MTRIVGNTFMVAWPQLSRTVETSGNCKVRTKVCWPLLPFRLVSLQDWTKFKSSKTSWRYQLIVSLRRTLCNRLMSNCVFQEAVWGWPAPVSQRILLRADQPGRRRWPLLCQPVQASPFTKKLYIRRRNGEALKIRLLNILNELLKKKKIFRIVLISNQNMFTDCALAVRRRCVYQFSLTLGGVYTKITRLAGENPSTNKLFLYFLEVSN